MDIKRLFNYSCHYGTSEWLTVCNYSCHYGTSEWLTVCNYSCHFGTSEWLFLTISVLSPDLGAKGAHRMFSINKCKLNFQNGKQTIFSQCRQRRLMMFSMALIWWYKQVSRRFLTDVSLNVSHYVTNTFSPFNIKNHFVKLAICSPTFEGFALLPTFEGFALSPTFEGFALFSITGFPCRSGFWEIVGNLI